MKTMTNNTVSNIERTYNNLCKFEDSLRDLPNCVEIDIFCDIFNGCVVPAAQRVIDGGDESKEAAAAYWAAYDKLEDYIVDVPFLYDRLVHGDWKETEPDTPVSGPTEVRDRLEVCYETYTAAEDRDPEIWGVWATFEGEDVTNDCLSCTFSDEDEVNIRAWAQRKANETGRSIDVEVYEAWECWDGRTSESTHAQFTIEPDPNKTEPDCDPCDVDGWEFELPDPTDWEYEPGGPMFDPDELDQYDDWRQQEAHDRKVNLLFLAEHLPEITEMDVWAFENDCTGVEEIDLAYGKSTMQFGSGLQGILNAGCWDACAWYICLTFKVSGCRGMLLWGDVTDYMGNTSEQPIGVANDPAEALRILAETESEPTGWELL